jgi:hypothetical protein
MKWDGQDERRGPSGPASAERRGALWSMPGGQRLPNSLDDPALAVGDPQHPARLRPADLDHPEDFHLRLKAWLLQQG